MITQVNPANKLRISCLASAGFLVARYIIDELLGWRITEKKMETRLDSSKGLTSPAPVYDGGVRGWQRWTPYMAVAWSLMYGMIGVYWMASRSGFPYSPETQSDGLGPLLGRFGPAVAWTGVVTVGIPAAIIGAAMLRGGQSKTLRPVFVTAGGLFAGVLLLLMTDLNLLITLGYTPLGIVKLIAGAEFGQVYLKMLTQWTTVHQLLCFVGGFLWLAATLNYTRRSGGTCLYCGRRDGPEGWQSPDQAARWGRIAVYVAMVAPVLYALTRYAWALGIPLGMSEVYLRNFQLSGTWVSGLFLATFGLVGAILMLGLVQRWGEVFPRWMIGLAGRQVPIALAVIPASLISVLLIVGGITIWSGLGQMAAASTTIQEIIFEVGPTLLFPVWGLALAVGTLGYYYRRRSPCSVCSRGASAESS